MTSPLTPPATVPIPMPAFRPLGPQTEPAWLRAVDVDSLRLREGLPFPLAEYRRRQDAVRADFLGRGAAALIVFRPSSVEYLCGYHTSTVTETPLVLTTDSVLLVLPTAELGRAVVAACPDVIDYADPHLDRVALAIREVCRDLGQDARVCVEFDDGHTPARAIDLIAAAGATPMDGQFAVERQRLLLSAAEVERMRAAASITARGVRAAVGAASRTGATDSTIAAAIIAALAAPSDCLVKPEVVVSTGWRGGITHSSWVNQPVARDTTTFLEFTGAAHHYVAPVMRTLVHGTPTREINVLDTLARAALDETLALLRPGVCAGDIARRVTRTLRTLRPELVWHHTYGYPVGMAHGQTWVDTVPFHLLSLRADCTAELRPGMAFHLPMSFRWFGRAAVGHSETVLITETGAEVLTTSAGEPRLIPV
jgi:Xaa-Pro aminopeptidase